MLHKIGLECIQFSVRLQKFRYGSGFIAQILAILLCKLLNLHKITRGAAIIAPLYPRCFLHISANIANCIPLLAHVIASNLLCIRGRPLFRSAVELENPEEIFRGILPIAGGVLIESTLSCIKLKLLLSMKFSFFHILSIYLQIPRNKLYIVSFITDVMESL